ncbi:MAG: AraC family transcriptional regulator ligand-binding domain-containing protein [Actinomycetota bacterium]
MAAGTYQIDPQVSILLADLGVSRADVLRRAGLPVDLFSRGAVSLSSSEYHRFWEALERELADGELPLRVADAFTAEAFSPPIFAALCSADLNEAAHRLQRYKPIIGPIRLDVDVDSDGTTVACRWLDEQPPSGFALAELLFWVVLARIGTRVDVQPRRVVTTDPPAEQAPYVARFGVTIESGPHHAITFAAADANRPFLTASAAMWERFEPTLRTRLAEVEAGASTEARVRAALVELLPAGRSGVRDVGGSLAMSSRTLQRRLGDEGTSYQAVLASTRERLARHYLSNDTISAGEIAFLLGYADASSFYRAFNDWTGLTPDRLRSGVA